MNQELLARIFLSNENDVYFHSHARDATRRGVPCFLYLPDLFISRNRMTSKYYVKTPMKKKNSAKREEKPKKYNKHYKITRD